jgi:hypothetical protein
MSIRALELGHEMTLPGLPESVREFRALARALAATPYQADAGALCVSELVTNAIVHTRSGLPDGSVMVMIEPAPAPRKLRITVIDEGPRAVLTEAQRRYGALRRAGYTGQVDRWGFARSGEAPVADFARNLAAGREIDAELERDRESAALPGEDENGRGLRIVAAVATEWGVIRAGGLTLTWCDIAETVPSGDEAR